MNHLICVVPNVVKYHTQIVSVKPFKFSNEPIIFEYFCNELFKCPYLCGVSVRWLWWWWDVFRARA